MNEQQQAWGVQSQAGPTKSENEDSFLTPEGLGAADWLPNTPELLSQYGALFAVADGVSGGPAGPQASQLAIHTILHRFYTDPHPNRAQALHRAVERANEALFAKAQQPQCKGMASTVVAAAVRREKVVIAQVGDSRAYLLREGRLSCLTRDHTWAQERYDEGLLTAEQRLNHPYRHILTRALGKDPQVAVAMHEEQLLPGDALLLCCDGLTDVVPESEIEGALRRFDPQTAADWLVKRATDLEAQDDVTVLVVQNRKRDGDQHGRSIAGALSAIATNRPAYFVALGAMFAVLAVMALGFWLWIQSSVGHSYGPAPLGKSRQGTRLADATVTPFLPALSVNTFPARPAPTSTIAPLPATTSPGKQQSPGNRDPNLLAAGGQPGGSWQLDWVGCDQNATIQVLGPNAAHGVPLYEVHALESEGAYHAYKVNISRLEHGGRYEPKAEVVHCTGRLAGGTIEMRTEKGGMTFLVTLPSPARVWQDHDHIAGQAVWFLSLLPK